MTPEEQAVERVADWLNAFKANPFDTGRDKAERCIEVVLAALAHPVSGDVEARLAAVRRVIEEGYPGQPAKYEKCPHDRFGYEDCITCYDEALLAALDGKLEALARGEGM